MIRVRKEGPGAHDLHTTGLHRHECDFQMFYVLKGWMRFVYEGQGEHTVREGDCVLQPAGIVHNELECSECTRNADAMTPMRGRRVASAGAVFSALR